MSKDKTSMDTNIAFSIIKNVIIEENKVMIKKIAQIIGKSEEELLKKYIKPEYYLPIIQRSLAVPPCNKNISNTKASSQKA